MATRVVRIREPGPQARLGVRRIADPAGTALMVAISGTVLAATLVVASLSTGGSRSLAAAQGPQPAPPPPSAAPEARGGLVSP